MGQRWQDTDPDELARLYRADADGEYARAGDSVFWWLFGLFLFFAPITAALLWVTR